MTIVPLHTFGRGGVHPGPHKEATAGRPIEELPAPREVRLPLLQHLGAPAIPVVKKGELVARGQVIAEGAEDGVPLHASISGKVKPIDRHPHPTLVMAQAIVIARADDAPPPLAFDEDPAWRRCPRDEALARIRAAGIVGLGGAAFPTWRKLVLAKDADTLVVNGAECEPYLTSDHRIMLAEPMAVVEGALVMAHLLGACRVLIGVEADKPDAFAALQHAIAEVAAREDAPAAVPPVTTGAPSAAEPAGAVPGRPALPLPVMVVPCEARYPQGAERQLVYALTGRSVPAGKLPIAVGVVVQNVATAAAVHDAVRFRHPLLDRVVTITGPGVRTPRNLRAPLGTLLGELVDACGGLTDDATRLVAGGPMMGRALPRLDVPLVKGMNGLVALTGESPFEARFGACIACGRCLEACPLGLEPDRVSVYAEAGRPLETERFGVRECYECGCCSYVCPAHRPLVQFMQVAKGALRRHDAVTAAGRTA
jgi:H+/Na+-translocating ferredoxin:NAD+ oxidoreductase subunit C